MADAWVFGATDPNSGTTVLLELARAFGKMLQQGWAPGRVHGIYLLLFSDTKRSRKTRCTGKSSITKFIKKNPIHKFCRTLFWPVGMVKNMDY